MSEYEEELESRCEQLEKQIQELEDRCVSLQNALGTVYGRISSLPKVSEGLRHTEYELLDQNADAATSLASDISAFRNEIDKIYDSCKDKCYAEILKWQQKENDILGSGD